MAQVDYLPARRLQRLIKELRVCADALHKQLDETRAQCALIEEVMREIRRQSLHPSQREIPKLPKLRVVASNTVNTVETVAEQTSDEKLGKP